MDELCIYQKLVNSDYVMSREIPKIDLKKVFVTNIDIKNKNDQNRLIY